MTQPAQYISGRTVQEQMNELIDYVDVRSAEVASGEAQQVLQPAEDAKDAAIQAKDDAQAAQAAAEQAVTDAAAVLANAVKKTGESNQSIAGNISVGGNLTVGGTAGFTGAVTVPAPANNTNAATKKYVDDADALKISINAINSYAVGLTGDQDVAGTKKRAGNAPSSSTFSPYGWLLKWNNSDVTEIPVSNQFAYFPCIVDKNGVLVGGIRIQNSNNNTISFALFITKRDGTTRSSKPLATYDFNTDTWS